MHALINWWGRRVAETVHFQMFFVDFRREIAEKCFLNEQKRLKMAEKSVLTSYRVQAAPKIWWKYTTTINFKVKQLPFELPKEI